MGILGNVKEGLKMQFDSRRSPVVAKNGMVATSQPLAAMAGLRIMMLGGNAVDAAVTSAAVLSVVEPLSTGVGGDMFALVWNPTEARVCAINGSGRAPAAASISELNARGHIHMPETGPYTISVPGTVHGWESLLRAYGNMPLSEILKPAIQYAENGFPVSEIIANHWSNNVGKLSEWPSGQELLLNGRAPKHGEIMRLPTLARTLNAIAEGGSEALYTGKIGQLMATFVQEQGGWLSTDDLANHTSDWDDAISTDYRGVRCWECPPNGQGIAALEALNIVEGFEIARMGAQTAATYHHLIEAMRLAFADALQYVADPRKASVPIADLLSKGYADSRRALINSSRAMLMAPCGKLPMGNDTVYISCVDSQGAACSLISSLYSSFGTGLVVPGTGIVLQNRAALFSLDANHPNALASNKRPFHTIIPAMATIGDELYLCYGVMGGFMQPQGHLQMISNLVDFAMNPQEAVNAPRFMVMEDSVYLEEGLPEGVTSELKSRGHNVDIVSGYNRAGMGGAQIIKRNRENGVLWGGSEPRKDGCAVGW
jgi:gamma-glutamyltranspeptidase/glutathione hydrolase